MKKQNGITLISLIITIIIMLILAGVSLSMVMGDGSIIDQANSATEKTRAGEVKEQIELWRANNKLAQYTHIGDESATELIDRLKTDGLITDDNVSGSTITVGEYTVDLDAIDTSTPELPKLATPVITCDGQGNSTWTAVEGATSYEVACMNIYTGVAADGTGHSVIAENMFNDAYRTGSFYWDDTLTDKYGFDSEKLVLTTNGLSKTGSHIKVRALPGDATHAASEWSEIAYIWECLAGETYISVYDEEKKKKKKKMIKDLKAGDKIIAFNPITKKWEVNKVLMCDSDETKMKLEYDVWIFSDDTRITTVNQHRFYNVEQEKMVYMNEWNIGDRIYKEDGTMPQFVKHEHVIEPIRHYTLVTENENYFANECLSGTRNTKEIKLDSLYPVDIA